jgi:site-specific DNA recombinase
MTKTAVLYARVSTKKQAEEDRFSLPQQLAALREHAREHGYEVVAEVEDPGYSGAGLERPGLDKVRDLVQEGGVSVVLAQDRDRFAREPAYLYLLKEEFARHGCALRALNSRGDDSAEGELTDGILDQLAKFERAKFMERTRRGKLQAAKQGRVLNSNAPMGFAYDGDGSYLVDEPRMAHVRAMFRRVGAEGESMASAKRAFERDGVKTQRGRAVWDATTIRRMIDQDAYLARTAEEVAGLPQVAPEVAAKLDPDKLYGVFWFNRQRIRKIHTGPVRNLRSDNDPSEWVAIPVPDSGVPREWVEGARAAVRDNTRAPDAGRHYWELKSLLFCPCGHRLTTFAARRKYRSKAYFTYHYVCSHRRRHGAGSCEHARYHNAPEVEGRVRGLVLSLLRNPEVMRQRVLEDVERERERLGRADGERAAWAAELAEVERRRDALIEMRADGDITREKFREKVAGLDARKAAAERELRGLGSTTRRLTELEALPALVEEYLRDLPYLLGDGREPAGILVREYETVPGPRTPDNPLGISTLTPAIASIRQRTPEEVEALREAGERARAARFRAIYETLALKATVRKDGTLEVSGAFGLREARLGEPNGAANETLPTPETGDDRCPSWHVSRHARYPKSRAARAGS